MEASYGKEPFNLRLLLLRLGRNLWEILALTILGTVLFGGGYYVKNVLLQPDPGYAASSTYKVEYVENPNAAGAYYINEATWNSLLHTGEFLDGVETHLQEAAERGESGAAAVLEQGRDRWIEALSAALPSDFSIPVTKATTQDPGESIALAHAVEETMSREFAESMPEITRIKVLDHGDLAEAVVPDVRPVRAVILAAVLGAMTVLLKLGGVSGAMAGLCFGCGVTELVLRGQLQRSYRRSWQQFRQQNGPDGTVSFDADGIREENEKGRPTHFDWADWDVCVMTQKVIVLTFRTPVLLFFPYSREAAITVEHAARAFGKEDSLVYRRAAGNM